MKNLEFVVERLKEIKEALKYNNYETIEEYKTVIKMLKKDITDVELVLKNIMKKIKSH